MPPADPVAEAGEIAVRGDHFAAVLDGHGGDVGVGDFGAADAAAAYQVGENGRVLGAWLGKDCERARQKIFAECQGVIRRGRVVKNSWVGGDAEESGEGDRGQGEGLGARRQCSQPLRIALVLR